MSKKKKKNTKAKTNTKPKTNKPMDQHRKH